MRQGIIFAGFGGQGIILSGLILCHAAMKEGKQVSHIPSYGAEMRGGTANCAVVVADSPIGSPLVRQPDVGVIMNKPSLVKYQPLLAAGGLLLCLLAIAILLVDLSSREQGWWFFAVFLAWLAGGALFAWLRRRRKRNLPAVH